MNDLIKNKQKYELLVDYIESLTYGTVIFHWEISNIINEAYNTPKYGSIITKAKEILWLRGKAIESIRGQGYRVMEPDSYNNKAVGLLKQGFSRIRTAEDILNNSPTKDMSEEGLMTHQNIQDKMRIVFAHTTGVRIEVNLLAKKPSAYLPENVGRK